MEHVALLIHSIPQDNVILKRALSAIEETSCLELEADVRALHWLGKEKASVDMVFLNYRSASLLGMIKPESWHLPTPVYLLVTAEEKERLECLAKLHSFAENFIAKPFDSAALSGSIDRLVKRPRARGTGVLLLQEAEASRQTVIDGFGHCGFLKIFEAMDAESAFELLRVRTAEVGLLAIHCEVPSLEAIRWLARLKQDPRFFDLPILWILSRRAIESMKARQAEWLRASKLFVYPFSERDLSQLRDVVTEVTERHRILNPFLREARMFRSRSDFTHAIACLQQALKRFPFEPVLHEALADCFISLFQKEQGTQWIEEALKACQSAIEFDPLCRALVQRCAEAGLQAGKSEDVIRLLKAQLLHAGFDDDSRIFLAGLYLAGGDVGAARVELRRALNVNSENPEARKLWQRAVIHA